MLKDFEHGLFRSRIIVLLTVKVGVQLANNRKIPFWLWRSKQTSRAGLICCKLLMIVLLAQLSTQSGLAQTKLVRPMRQPVDVASGKQGVVVSDTVVASEIGRDILANGGNAVDAAVATAFALAVTWPEAGNIGGGGFMMVAPPGKKVVCVEYREKAPALVDEFSFAHWKNRLHARMAGVPGTVRGMALAHQKFGKLPWKSVVEPAARVARDGFTVDSNLAYSLNSVLKLKSIQTDPRYTEFYRVFGHPEKRLWKSGDRLFQPDLAATLQLIAIKGPAAFYEGKIAKQIVKEMKRDNGLISAKDLQQYSANIRPAIEGTFRNYTIYGAPPPSSGGITVLMQMRMIDKLNLKVDCKKFWTADQVHLLSEVMRRSFRERAAYLGDPDFVTIPEKVLDAKYAYQLASTIDPIKATPSAEIAGDIPLTKGPYESPQTTHFSVIDANGMAVSNTYTLEYSWGSRVVVRGAGFLLNNEMGDFNWYPGYTNDKGIIGTKPNLLAPGKRMLSSQTPTIVKQNSKVRLIVGSPGGRTIINTVSSILVQTLLFKRSLKEAVDGPRIHQQWFPDLLKLESGDHGLFENMKEDLIKRGHTIYHPKKRRQGSAQSIEVDIKTGVATGVGDWRRGGSARAVCK